MTQWGLDTLFNPAKRHMDDEKRRLQSTRAEVGDNSGGKRINLDSGKVFIQKPDDEPDAADTSNTPDAPTSAGESTARKTAKAAQELTPAQLRAAKRRGRAV